MMLTKVKKIKPNKARIRKWVAALRSGKYKQTKRQLQRDDAYCCLGVAQRIFKGKPLSRIEKNLGYMTHSCARYFGLVGKDPDSGHEIVANPPLLLTKKHGRKIPATELNDRLGWNFKRIANAIERTFLE